MKIAFHLYFMTMRGTEVATYDFADYNEKALGNKSVIVYSETTRGPIEQQVLEKFRKRFTVIKFEGDIYDKSVAEALGKALRDQGVEALYNHEVYREARWVCPPLRNLIHATFPWCPQRGDAYAYTSSWLARPTGGKYVPLIIELPEHDLDMREKLNIPPDAIVFGRYGGETTFNISFVHQAIKQVIKRRRDVYFLFMNTRPFMQAHPQVIHLPGTHDAALKTAFINTCDAMLHARQLGESFGLAVGEFSIRNKPVLTWLHSEHKAHIEHLGNKGLFYKQYADLLTLLENFPRSPEGNWDAYSEHFSPKAVMQQFEKIFLEGGNS